MQRERALILAGSAAMVAIALAATLAVMRGQHASINAQVAAPMQGDFAVVELREVPTSYAADAVIEAVRAATVSSQIAGTVTHYYVDAGDRVKRGQLLMRLDTRQTDAQVAAGVASVAQAEAQLAQAKLGYERTAKLVEQRFVSQSALDKADAELKSAAASLQMARAGAAQAVTARSFAELRAPIDGVVTRRLAEIGELASAGKPLIEMHDPTKLRAVAGIPQFVLLEVAQAQTAVVVLSGGDTVSAIRVTVLPAADARLLSTQVRADLPEQLPPGVVPGTAAKVLLATGTTKRLVVPADAVIRRSELTAVYVVAADGTLRLRQIRVGESVGSGLIEVLAGLDAGERVQLRAAMAAARR